MKMFIMNDFYSKYEFPLRKKTGNEETEIRNIEVKLGYDLPMDYKHFLNTYTEHEIEIFDHSVILWDLFELIEINADYLIFEEFSDVLSIGSNGGGECIALDFIDEKPSVILFPFIGMERSDFIKIGNSFSDFLRRLDNGIGWFDDVTE